MFPETKISVQRLDDKTPVMEIHGAARGRKTGLFISPNGFTGWDDSPVIASEDVEHIYDDLFDMEPRFRGRLLNAEGIAVSDSEEELGHLQSGFMRLAVRKYRYVVTHQGRTLWADGRAAETIQFRDTGYRNGFAYAKFLLPVKFPDSLRYGETETFGGTSVTCYQQGNETTLPLIYVTGSMPSGYSIHGPNGERYNVSQPLTSGVTHLIDMKTGWLFRDGQLQTGAVTRAETWGVAPGADAQMSIVPVSGPGTIRVEVTDAHA